MLASSCLQAPRWRRHVLSVETRAYDWLDVFLSAMLRDEWRSFEGPLVEGLADGAVAGTDGEPEWPDARRVELAGDAFRYERGLIAGDDAMAWLDRSGLTVDAWHDYLVRSLVREDSTACSRIIPRGQLTEVRVTEADFAAEGICSGKFDRFLRALAGRAALLAEEPDVDDSAEVDVRTIDRVLATHAAWLTGVNADEVKARLGHLVQLESLVLARTRAAVTPDALLAQLACHRLAWTRVDLERLSFDDLGAAREAACRVRDDGLTLSEVAIDTRRPVRDTRDLLERLEPELRSAVLGADRNQLVGPLCVAMRYEIAVVVGRAPADLSDALVRARAEAALLDQMYARAIRAHARWAEGPRA